MSDTDSETETYANELRRKPYGERRFESWDITNDLNNRTLCYNVERFVDVVGYARVISKLVEYIKEKDAKRSWFLRCCGCSMKREIIGQIEQKFYSWYWITNRERYQPNFSERFSKYKRIIHLLKTHDFDSSASS